jgi:hypothetical protein
MEVAYRMVERQTVALQMEAEAFLEKDLVNQLEETCLNNKLLYRKTSLNKVSFNKYLVEA